MATKHIGPAQLFVNQVGPPTEPNIHELASGACVERCREEGCPLYGSARPVSPRAPAFRVNVMYKAFRVDTVIIRTERVKRSCLLEST